MTGLEWTQPWALLLALFAVPAWFLGHRAAGRVIFSSLRVLPRHASTWRTRLAWLPDTLMSLAIVSLAIAMAGPRKGEHDARIHSEGIAIAMAVDTSSSMAALDLSDRSKEKTRLDAVKDVFEQFVAGRPDDLIGMVSFARYADTRAPLTLDHGDLLAASRATQLTVPNSADDGTAIGDGLALAVERLSESPARSKVVILLTDGDDNASQMSPDEAANFALEKGVIVYTVGAGTTGVAPIRETDPMSGQSVLMQMPVHIDEDLLKSIADKTNGKYFRADNADALRTIYGEIDKLQPSHFDETRFYSYQEYFEWFAAAAMILAVLGLLLRATVLRRSP